MIENKVISKVEILDNKEKSMFNRFIAFEKPFFESEFRMFIDIYKQCNEQEIFKTLFPKRKYSNVYLRFFYKELNKLVDSFFSFLEQKKDPRKQHIYGIQFLKAKGAWKNLETEQKKFSKNISQQKKSKQLIYELLMFEEIRHLSASEVDRRNDNYLLSLEEKIDEYYWYEKLKINCDKIIRSQVFNVQYSYDFLDHSLNFIPPHYLENNVLIKAYYLIFVLFKKDSEEDFRIVLELLNTNINKIEHEELKDLYACLQNYCIRKANSGHAIYLNYLFEIYDQLIKHRIIFHNNVLNIFDYKNIATLGIRLKEFEWVKTFTEEYTSFLPKEYRSSATAFNLARILFFEKKYKEAIQKLQHVSFADVYYEVGARTLLVKIYYEQDDWIILDTIITSFKVYLNRNKRLSELVKNNTLNFLKYTAHLIKNSSQSKLEKSYHLVKNNKSLLERDWLLAKYKNVLQKN